MSYVLPSAGVPAQEVPLCEDLVRRLLADQHPDLASLPLEAVAEGWDNAIFRLGTDFAVRMPRRALAVDLVAKELEVVPRLAERLEDAGIALALPVPLRAGLPGRGYPWPWSVVRWADGVSGLELPEELHGGAPTVVALAAFLAALHAEAGPEAPRNPFRDGGLGSIDAAVRARLARVSDRPGTDELARLWETLRSTPALGDGPCWIHGDLHPGNLLYGDDGRLAAVIDFGDVCGGDPAVDLAVAWQLFGRKDRDLLARELGVLRPGLYGPQTWLRSAGWALHFGLLSVATEGNDPAFVRIGEATLTRLLRAFPAVSLSRGGRTVSR